MKTVELSGLPACTESERMVLGAILSDPISFSDVQAALRADDFSLAKHRHIYNAMSNLQATGAPIDRVTVAHELMRMEKLDACDGLTYLCSLDEGIPLISNVDAYCRRIRDKSVLRRAML